MDKTLDERCEEAKTTYRIYHGDCEFCIGLKEQTDKHRELIRDMHKRIKELELENARLLKINN